MHLEPNEPANLRPVRIPARSRRQAMDWSLVLASQGIEPVIELAAETGWALVVSPQDYDSGSAAWVVLTVVFFWLSDTRANLPAAGIMDGAAVARGEWWRLFTATLLHADLGHLAANAVFGLVLIGLAMGQCGTGVGLLAAYLAGAGGNVASWLVYGEAHHGLGASGVVMGALGLLAVQSLPLLKGNPHAVKLAIAGLVGGVMLFVLLGLNPETDVVAHAGGFVAGLVLGSLLALAPRLAPKPLVNLGAGFLFTALVVLTWLLALTR